MFGAKDLSSEAKEPFLDDYNEQRKNPLQERPPWLKSWNINSSSLRFHATLITIYTIIATGMLLYSMDQMKRHCIQRCGERQEVFSKSCNPALGSVMTKTNTCCRLKPRHARLLSTKLSPLMSTATHMRASSLETPDRESTMPGVTCFEVRRTIQ